MRAVKHGQESLILRKYIHEPGHNKAIAPAADHVMKEIGEMLGKRDRDVSPGPMPSAGTDDSDWSAVTPGGNYVGNLGYAPPMPAQDLSSHARPFENKKIPLPADVELGPDHLQDAESQESPTHLCRDGINVRIRHWNQ